MKMICKMMAGLFILIPFIALAGNAPKNHYKKTKTLLFTVEDNASLQLSNEYGDITFYRWDKNEISATITITVKADNEDAAKKIAGGIQIEQRADGNSVYIRTNYSKTGDQSGSFWKMFFGGNITSRKSVSIDYKVYVPKSLGKMDIQNKYGDIRGNQLPGKVHIKMSYGNFHLSDIQQPFDLDVRYGDGSITDVANATIDAGYTDFHFDKVKQLKMQYEYGDVKIGSAGIVELNGSYGDVYASHIGKLMSTTKYSDYQIDYIGTDAVIETSYGDIKINKTGDKLNQLEIGLNYSDLYANISGVPLNIEVSLQYGDLDADLDGLQVIGNTNKGSKTLYKARSSSGGQRANIQINGRYSDVELDND